MKELKSLMKRKAELTWSMVLCTPETFNTSHAFQNSLELDQVTARINALTGRA